MHCFINIHRLANNALTPVSCALKRINKHEIASAQMIATGI